MGRLTRYQRGGSIMPSWWQLMSCPRSFLPHGARMCSIGCISLHCPPSRSSGYKQISKAALILLSILHNSHQHASLRVCKQFIIILIPKRSNKHNTTEMDYQMWVAEQIKERETDQFILKAREWYESRRAQCREYLRSGCGGPGGGYDRVRVVEAGGGLTGDCSLTTASDSSVLATSSGGSTSWGMYLRRTSNGGVFM